MAGFMSSSSTVMIGLTSDNIQGGFEWANKSPVNFIFWEENGRLDQRFHQIYTDDVRLDGFSLKDNFRAIAIIPKMC